MLKQNYWKSITERQEEKDIEASIIEPCNDMVL